MEKTILLIRHAQSANNALPECERVPDPALTALGLVQAERLAQGLAQFPVSELFCSPFRRSLDTALPASRSLRIRPSIRADIYEQGGCYRGFEPGKLLGEPGMGRAELEANYPGWAIDEAIGPHGWNAGREYESCAAVKLRAAGVARWLSQTWTPTARHAVAALIIHADFKRILLAELLQSDQWPDSMQPIWNTGISLLRFAGNAWQLLEWNSAAHLPPDLRTPVSTDVSAA
jgi:2,3-bisphosphoglycerate-dependent phosphoglycerate mutase